MRRIDLPGGQWADLRDTEEVTTGGKRKVLIILAGLTGAVQKLADASDENGVTVTDPGLTETEVEGFLRMQDAAIVALLAAWSLPDPLPTLDNLTDLPSGLYDAIVAETTNAAMVIAGLGLNTGTGGEVDPKASSAASKPSGTRSKAGSARTRTSKSQTGGSRSSTGS